MERSSRLRRTFAVGLLAAGLAGLPAVAGAELYRYVDKDGRTHFTNHADDVPPAYRDQLRDISEDVRARVNVIPALRPQDPQKQAESESPPGLSARLQGLRGNADLARKLATAFVVLGPICIVAGIMMRPKGVGIGLSFFWGLAKNSTGTGKLVFFLGMALLTIGIDYFQTGFFSGTP